MHLTNSHQQYTNPYLLPFTSLFSLLSPILPFPLLSYPLPIDTLLTTSPSLNSKVSLISSFLLCVQYNTRKWKNGQKRERLALIHHISGREVDIAGRGQYSNRPPHVHLTSFTWWMRPGLPLFSLCLPLPWLYWMQQGRPGNEATTTLHPSFITMQQEHLQWTQKIQSNAKQK